LGGVTVKRLQKYFHARFKAAAKDKNTNTNICVYLVPLPRVQLMAERHANCGNIMRHKAVRLTKLPQTGAHGIGTRKRPKTSILRSLLLLRVLAKYIYIHQRVCLRVCWCVYLTSQLATWAAAA